MNKLLIFCLFIFSGLVGSAQELQEARLLRFPAVHGDQVVFAYAGDLYRLEGDSGIARRITSHEGYEVFPRFSPNGEQLAFTGQYQGNTEVYVMPATGGNPERITYTATLGRDEVSDRMGPNNIILTWRDDNTVLYRTRGKSFNAFKGHLYLADLDGALPEQLPLPAGGFSTFSPDRTKLAFNKVFREFRTWKYYKGGMADDIWVFDFNTNETKQITDNAAQDIMPMWHGNSIFFISDRDRIMNLFEYNNETGETHKVTSFDRYDIKFPSIGEDKIIFENGGYLYTYHIPTQELTKLKVYIANDQVVSQQQWVDASEFIFTADVSPDGEAALFAARGDLWTVPEGKGVTRNITSSDGVHNRNPKYSPDGEWIAFISDDTGEDEIYIQKADGSEEPVQLTSGGTTYKYHLLWSPNSMNILWADRDQQLQYVNVMTKRITQVDQSPAGEITQFDWAPDSRWIAYRKPERGTMDRIWVYGTAEQTSFPVTESWYYSGQPEFSEDGKYLFFVSSRDFSPVYSHTEWNHAYVDMERPYLLTLRKDVVNPLDELVEQDDEEGEDADAEEGEVTVYIDRDDLADRVVALPVDASNYYGLEHTSKGLYYMERGLGDKKGTLKRFDFADREEKELGEVEGYDVADDAEKMLVHTGKKWGIIDLPTIKLEIEEPLDLSGMQKLVDLQTEWRQVFGESWRQMREFFYDPGMHGVDWADVRAKYEVLLPYVAHRADLSYIIGEMIGELNIGHAYAGGGDLPEVERKKMGLLGAEYVKDAGTGYFRITKILNGQNWNDETRSPLEKIGVDVNEGDYIIAINGQPTNRVENIHQLLMNMAGKPVELTVNGTATATGAEKYVVEPIADESSLRYYEWVQNNIDYVDSATNGQVGYLHIPDMGRNGLNEFIKHFYPQLGKKALIIDDRGNGGGNVSPMIIERLNRQLAMVSMMRNSLPETNPYQMHLGPKVLLIDQYSASDGDLFPYRFKKLDMGTVIGQRSWGGVVGIRGSLPFVDKGYLMKPEFAPYDTEGKEWIIEGYGVDPDIEVVNDPYKEYIGIDQQLNKAIETALQQMEEQPTELPEMPPFPDKTK